MALTVIGKAKLRLSCIDHNFFTLDIVTDSIGSGQRIQTCCQGYTQ